MPGTYSQFPPCSGRPGTVRAPSLPTFPAVVPFALPAWAFSGCGGRATSRSNLLAAARSPSRLFHSAKTSADGAQPRMPGWMRPANLTCGMWREVQKMPSKSHMAFALNTGESKGNRGVYGVLASLPRFTVLERKIYGVWGNGEQPYAEGYISSRNPPPFRRSNTPLKPQGWS